MTTVVREMTAPPERVFDVLGDGWLYPVWVVGASRMRDVDSDWPAVGSKIHHSVGVWPLLLSDDTEVLESLGPERLVLRTKGRPFGVAEVTMEIAPEGHGSRVAMTEKPTGGPGRWIHNPLNAAILRQRNVESLRRLAWIVENRDPSDSVPWSTQH